MEFTTANVYNFKLQLQSVIENLEKLEQIQKDEPNSAANETASLISNTAELLASLEGKPTSKIRKILEKRKRRRHQVKLKRKQKTTTNDSSQDNLNARQVPKEIYRTNLEITTSHKPAQKPHQQLKSYRDANRFLKTFELLEILHATRSQDEATTREFAAKLFKLRRVWNVIRSENKPDYTAAQNLEDQWNSVIFGTNEKSFYKEKRSLADLVNIRRKWDSFITNDPKMGSTIPNHWVLPPENADERWQHYKIQ